MKNQPTKLNPIYLRDYKPSNFLIKSIDLHVELDEDVTRVHSTLSVYQNVHGEKSNTLKLDGEALKLISVHLNKKQLTQSEYQVSDKHLIIENVPNEFELEIVTEIKPQENTALSGLYRSKSLFCTQCEAEGFRRITYYMDRPDVLALFTTTIVADKSRYPVMLSNGNLIETGMIDDKRHYAKWHDPFKKPCYLFAMVAGDLVKIADSFVTASKKTVALEFYVEPAYRLQCSYAVNALKKAMKWDEEQYGREYDLDVYMIVAVDDFNMGAMENKGLNIFNTKYILADEVTSTDTDFQNVEAVIGHEYFHNWSGNRVTCRDWFQLSLKEGLTVFREQQFSEQMGLSTVKRINDVRIIRTRQFAEDAGPMSHPVRPSSYIEINNFYTSTVYNKGAEVIRMLHTLLGAKGFRKGMDLYFSTFDGQAVTIEDFIAAHEKANNISLKQFLNWYNQAGTPVISIKDEYDVKAKTYSLTLTQTCKPDADQKEKQPFLIPIKITIYDKAGKQQTLVSNQLKETEQGQYLILDKRQETFVFEGLTDKPLPSFLGNFSAPVKLEYAYSEEDLANLMCHDKDPFNRWDAQSRLACQTLMTMMTANAQGKPVEVSPILMGAYEQLLQQRDNTEPGLLALMLALPSFQYIAELLPMINTQAIIDARRMLLNTYCESMQKYFQVLYTWASQNDGSGFENQKMAVRSLKNTSLYYLVRGLGEEGLAIAQNQYHTSLNMTDRMGALNAINHLTHSIRESLFDDFYQRFKNVPLVVNKWFSLQATSDRPEVLNNIRSLMKHEAFDINNPNKVYSLINAFALANPERFHDPEGEGYAFLADRIIELNTRNPQIAARLLEGLTQWKRLEGQQGQLMKRELLRISEVGKLSDDVYEIVTKSLM